MPVNEQRAVLKTALLAPGGMLLTWGVQLLIDGDPLTGVLGLLTGTLFIAGFVALEEYDIPYESEIVTLLESQDSDQVAETAQDAAESVSEEIDGSG